MENVIHDRPNQCDSASCDESNETEEILRNFSQVRSPHWGLRSTKFALAHNLNGSERTRTSKIVADLNSRTSMASDKQEPWRNAEENIKMLKKRLQRTRTLFRTGGSVQESGAKRVPRHPPFEEDCRTNRVQIVDSSLKVCNLEGCLGGFSLRETHWAYMMCKTHTVSYIVKGS